MEILGRHVVSDWSQGVASPLGWACTVQLPWGALLPRVCTQSSVLKSSSFLPPLGNEVTIHDLAPPVFHRTELIPSLTLSPLSNPVLCHGLQDSLRFWIHLQRVWEGVDTGPPMLGRCKGSFRWRLRGSCSQRGEASPALSKMSP